MSEEQEHTDPRHPEHISYYGNRPRKPREESKGVEHPLMCNGKHQPMRLGVICKAGIYFWCKSCHGRQLIAREEIMRKWEELDKIEAENASIETRTMLY